MTGEHDDDAAKAVDSKAVDSRAVDVEAGSKELDETSKATESVDGAADSAPEPEVAPRPSRVRRLLVPVVLAALLLGAVGFASWAYLAEFRPDREISADVASDTIKSATDGSIAMLSYAPETMDKDFANAKSHLTGDFLNYYSKFTHDIVTPAVQQKLVKTSATVVQSAVSELKPGSAVVLLFLNQTTTSKENHTGTFTASSVKVGLTEIDGAWLIASFDPV